MVGRFFFLEMNTRLQVEHPVTELVTGLDLVRLQLLVAEGAALPPEAITTRITGHAVEARLYAEDVPAGFLPATGTVHRFTVPDLPGVRVDSGVVDGSAVGVHYDSMLAKVIAHAPTRDEACRLLARALATSQVHGVLTNRDLLVGVLREPEFRARAATMVLPGRDRRGYRFAHDLLRECLQLDVAAGERSRIHLRAAEHLESTGNLDAAPHIAHHRLSALPPGDPTLAVHAAIESAEWGLSFDDATTFQRALLGPRSAQCSHTERHRTRRSARSTASRGYATHSAIRWTALLCA